SNEEGLRLDIDLLPERRDIAALKMPAHHRRASNYFNKRVKPKTFQVRDLVLRNAAAAGHYPNKLDLKWEGPFEVEAIVSKGAYRLKVVGRKSLPHPWNALHLKKYFS